MNLDDYTPDDSGGIIRWDAIALYCNEVTGFEIGDENYDRLVKAFDAIKALDY